ncbi:MAG: hypothetical protein ACRDRN_08995 [Sciscionella sp.]
MGMSAVLAHMPDLWLRILDEHVPDHGNQCRACRDDTGIAARWPCLTRTIAENAQAIYRSGR